MSAAISMNNDRIPGPTTDDQASAPAIFAQAQRMAKNIAASRKYRQVAPELILQLANAELSKNGTATDAEERVRRKLHQVGAAFLTGNPKYDQWLGRISAAANVGDLDQLKLACLGAMQRHVSSSERVLVLDRFYSDVLPPTDKLHSIIDLACGLSPLAISWMNLRPGTVFSAYDIYSDMVAFLNDFFGITEAVTGVKGCAKVLDLSQAVPQQHADLAFMLKIIPTLDQIRPGQGAWLLQQINAEHVVVSYPAKSIGGRDKGMRVNYETQFSAITATQKWRIAKYEFPSELVFLVHKPECAAQS